MAPTFDASPEDLQVFLQEAQEQLQLLDEDIIRLEKEADNVQLLQGIFRAAHTLKGSSAMLGFQEMAQLTHAMEDVLDKLRKGTLGVTPELVDALLASLDGLNVLKDNLDSEEQSGVDVEHLAEALRALAKDEAGVAATGEAKSSLEAAVAADPVASTNLRAAAEAGSSMFRIVSVIEPESPWASVRLFQVLNELSQRGKVISSVPSQEEIEQEKGGFELQAIVTSSQTADELRSAVESLDDVQSVTVDSWRDPSEAGVAVDGAPQLDSRQGELDDYGRFQSGQPPEGKENQRVIDLGPEARGKSQREQLEMAAEKIGTLQTVRIDVEQLDALMNMVGELAIDRTRIAQISRVLLSRYKDDELVQALGETSAHVVKVVNELHQDMMQVRMLPIGLLFSRFPRLVRDLSRSNGKSIEFVVEGQDTEIDRSVIEKIKDPLVHLIRNAVDHGIEPLEARQAAGKPDGGLIKLSARHDQGYIVITLEDDGGGIDAQRVKESAVRKGIVSAEVAERMSDAEALDLIFKAGVSTAEKTTEVSGRGVGMDIVMREVQALNGLVQVHTDIGVGTKFTLRLPLTLATFRGLLVESAKTAYAIPLSYVQETVRPEATSVGTVMGKRVLNLRGSLMPLLRLSTICGTESENGNHTDNDFVVVLNGGDRPVALAVDALMDQQEIVVKMLGGYVGQTKGIAGASILGDGHVVLILDVPSLIRAGTQDKG